MVAAVATAAGREPIILGYFIFYWNGNPPKTSADSWFRIAILDILLFYSFILKWNQKFFSKRLLLFMYFIFKSLD